MHDLGKIIRFHRKKSGLSQQQLANVSGVGKTLIFDLEKGKMTVKIDSILKVLKVLNIHIELHSPLMHLWKESVHEKS